MLCDICKKNNATVHVTTILNGVKHETNICEKCARERENITFPGIMDMSSTFTFQNILSGLMDYMKQTGSTQNEVENACPSCGTTYSDFKKSGILGCSECYKNFDATLMPVIKRVQGSITHIGKIPQKSGKEIIEKRKITNLKDDLKKAITAEEYERAAIIRDEIKDIQNGEV